MRRAPRAPPGRRPWLLDIQRGFWVDITIAVILRPYIVTTFERGMQRVVGTVLGCFLAAGLLAAVSGDVAVVAVLLALAFATFAVLPLNYGWAVLFLTPLVVLMVSFALGAGPAVAIDRIVDTLIGGAIAVAAATLLWPRSERGDFGPALGRALALDREYVSAVLAGRDAAPAGRRAATAADDLEARYRRLAGEPHRGRRGIGAVWEAVAANRRLYLATVALDAQLGGLGAEVFQGWTRSRRGCAMRSPPSPMAIPLHPIRSSAPSPACGPTSSRSPSAALMSCARTPRSHRRPPRCGARPSCSRNSTRAAPRFTAFARRCASSARRLRDRPAVRDHRVGRAHAPREVVADRRARRQVERLGRDEAAILDRAQRRVRALVGKVVVVDPRDPAAQRPEP
ncbi:MAG: FUSC family protein [Solirubrobacteraceae bacterium]